MNSKLLTLVEALSGSLFFKENQQALGSFNIIVITWMEIVFINHWFFGDWTDYLLHQPKFHQ